MSAGVNFLNEQTAFGAVTEVELHHVLFLAGDVCSLRRSVHDMIAVAGQLLHGISASLEAVDGKAASGAGLIGADHSASCAAGTGHVPNLENSPLNGFPGNGIIFPDDEGAQGCVLKADSFALISVNNDRLRDGFLELESVRRFQLGDGKFTRIQPLTKLVDPDLTSGVREYLAIVDGGGSLRRLAVAGIADTEFSVFNRFPGDTIFLENRQFGRFSIAENQRFFIAGAEGNGLGPVRILVREVVRRGHGFFRDLVGAGFHP